MYTHRPGCSQAWSEKRCYAVGSRQQRDACVTTQNTEPETLSDELQTGHLHPTTITKAQGTSLKRI